jgi:hypothetical protein
MLKGDFMKNDNFCPFHEGFCDDRCGLFDTFHTQCSLASLVNTLCDVENDLSDVTRTLDETNQRLVELAGHDD